MKGASFRTKALCVYDSCTLMGFDTFKYWSKRISLYAEKYDVSCNISLPCTDEGGQNYS